MRVAERIAVPALIIASEDDPFVPSQPFSDPKLTGNPHIDLRLCAHGGHCGFVGPRSGEDDGYWAERQIVDFVVSGGASTIAPPRDPDAPSEASRTRGLFLLPRA